MTRQWSKYQKAVFDTYRNENCNIAVTAVPGSGKTTVLKQLCKLTPSSDKSVFLAFNKSIVEDLKQALPSSTQVQTLHSLGMGAIIKHYGQARLFDGKTFTTLKKLEPKWKADLKDVKNVKRYFYQLSQLYDLFRINVLTDVGDEIISIADKFGVKVTPMMLKHLQQLVNTMIRVNRGSKSIFKVDYLDMIYLPVAKDMDFGKYDVVFLDECQDLNECQHRMVAKLLGRRSRLVSVGDPNQCIYSFLGADARSFEKFAERANTKTLPLSVTYRCPTKVVEKINEVYDVVEPAPNAPEGDVRDGELKEAQYGDMILCRNNKPLLKAYFDFIGQNKKSWIKGAEFGKTLIKAVSKYKELTCESALEYMVQELDRLHENLLNRGVAHPKYNSQYIKLSDNITLFRVMAENYVNVAETLPVIEEIFVEDGEGIMLSTIHKAKGLEADTVFLLCPELIPSKFAKEDWQIEQEQKLLFVAYSRPKKELIFIRNYIKDDKD